MFGRGVSKEGDVLDLAVERGVVGKTGAWYSFNEERIGQGRENVKRFLGENPDVFAEIERRVRGALGIGGPEAAAAPETPAPRAGEPPRAAAPR